jgi:pimeloyl-ACP methyl ester carboxylesterase
MMTMKAGMTARVAKTLRTMVIAVAILCTAGPLVSARAQTEPAAGRDYAADTRALLQLMFDGKFADVHARLNGQAQKMITPEKLGEVWRSLSAQAGTFKGFGTATVSTEKDMHLVLLPTQFERVQIVWRAAWDADGSVAGFVVANVVPMDTGATGSKDGTPAIPKPFSGVPAYVDSTRFHCEEVTIGEDPWKLPGTLCLPAQAGGRAPKNAPAPAIILVHGSGSGSGDRDETIGPNKPFRDLAGGLAARGIAVLRYDKRTYVHGAQMDVRTTTVEEEALADVSAAIELLKGRKEIDRKHIYILGHSLGGTLTPIVGERHPELGGLILLAAGARPILPVIAEQIRYVGGLDGNAASAASADSVARTIESWMDPDLPDTLLVLGGGASLHYFRDLEQRSATQAAARLKMPILVLQGGRDYQVTQADLDLWKSALAGNSKATFEVYPDLNHLFQKGEGKAVPAEYMKAVFVSVEVVGDIADWIHMNSN